MVEALNVAILACQTYCHGFAVDSRETRANGTDHSTSHSSQIRTFSTAYLILRCIIVHFTVRNRYYNTFM